jgi:N-acylglucosamine 2-epimerase (GlcNAc 2-epimerase)
LTVSHPSSLHGGKAAWPADRIAAIAPALDRFTAWLERYGETSFDHQSYFAGPIGGRAKALYYRSPRLGLPAVAPMIASEALLPSARRLFWRKQRFPIADAHYAMGYALLAQRGDSDGAHYRRALHFVEVLERTRCSGYERHGWGYPFDWVTRNGVMAAQTPLITSTPYAYEAFAAVHGLDGQPRWQQVMQSIAEHALRDIADIPTADDAASCGYNPHDKQGQVINASAYRAFLLSSAALRFGRDDYRDAARRNLHYVLRSQQPDGSWRYATDGVRDFVDHFHTCFVLKALAKIEALGVHESSALRSAIESGVAYYTRHLFNAEGLPQPFAKAPRLTVYRHELYDYAECINLGTLLAGRFPALDERLRSTVADLLARWQKPDGSFRSRRLLLGWDNVPMHRWAQAQVFRSLALLLARAESAGSRGPATTAATAARAPAMPAAVSALS